MHVSGLLNMHDSFHPSKRNAILNRIHLIISRSGMMIHHPSRFSSVSLLACFISHLLRCLRHGSSPPHPSGEQRPERQLHLLAALHPRGVSQRITGGSERGGGQHHFTFSEEHPQAALPLQGQPSSPPTAHPSLRLPPSVPPPGSSSCQSSAALFQNRDSEKKAAEGKGEAGAVRGVPIKQVCRPENPGCLLQQR